MTVAENNNAKQVPSWSELRRKVVAKAMKDESFREALRQDPKGVLEVEVAEVTGDFQFPADLQVKIIEQPVNTLCLVLPSKEEELSTEELDDIAGGYYPGEERKLCKPISFCNGFPT